MDIALQDMMLFLPIFLDMLILSVTNHQTIHYPTKSWVSQVSNCLKIWGLLYFYF